MAKYVFDSNIFINLQRRQPIDIYPSLWSKIGDLMENGTIISSQEVYDEIMIGGKTWKNGRKLGKNAFFHPVFLCSNKFEQFWCPIVD